MPHLPCLSFRRLRSWRISGRPASMSSTVASVSPMLSWDLRSSQSQHSIRKGRCSSPAQSSAMSRRISFHSGARQASTTSVMPTSSSCSLPFCALRLAAARAASVGSLPAASSVGTRRKMRYGSLVPSSQSLAASPSPCITVTRASPPRAPSPSSSASTRTLPSLFLPPPSVGLASVSSRVMVDMREQSTSDSRKSAWPMKSAVPGFGGYSTGWVGSQSSRS
mmetsp:Transcript_86388/g.230770  ORF Transcript_86388/g.230770 Transcript_86388/m.230770 type:complete len:222 (+) Transcript_86388:960-1625(+)